MKACRERVIFSGYKSLESIQNALSLKHQDIWLRMYVLQMKI